MSDSTILVSLNYFGTPVAGDYLDRLGDGSDHRNDMEYRSLAEVLGAPPEHLPRAVLERYVEVSPPESYLPLFPHTEKIFERILSPLRSAKRCYCLGEYLATIELCAHVGEMFAILLWQMRPFVLNGKPLSQEREAQLFGSTFERKGQEQRIKMLKAIGGVEEADAQRLDELRKRLRKYFHLWSEGVSDARADAFHCFWQVVNLAESVLQISFDDGKLIINPALQAYVNKHSADRQGQRQPQ